MDRMTGGEQQNAISRESNRINCYDLITQTRHWIRIFAGGEQTNETEKYRRAFSTNWLKNSPAVI